MSINFIWKVNQLERNATDGGIIVAHWDCVGTDDNTEKVARVYGSSTLGPADPDSPDFIPFEDLVEQQVLEWVWQIISKEEYETSLTDQIDLLNNPPTLTGMPW